MNTRLRIDIVNGALEVEGTEDFVLRIYEDFKEQLAQSKRAPSRGSTVQKQKPNSGASSKRKQKSGTSRGKQALKLIPDLDLKAKNGQPSLRDFYGQYDCKTNYQRNLIFVYYLTAKKELSDIAVNHIYTCYKEVGVKVPGALRQSLLDTSGDKGWFDTSDMDNIMITTVGENYIEHDIKTKDS